MNRYYKKNKNGLDYLGEGKIVKKSQIKLKEEKFNVMVPKELNKNLDSSVRYAQKVVNNNPNISGATVQSNKQSSSMPINTSSKNPQMNITIPKDADPKQTQQAKNILSTTPDTNITVSNAKSQQSGSTMPNTTNNPFEQKMRAKSKRLMEIRKKSVDFTKSELRDFLRTV